MIYKNPILKGFYPDPSVCAANGKFYMVCSSFQFFPGVPLFESGDLVNWRQLGHVLTRKSQVMLSGVASSGGIFAPTIRFNNGRFYMVTTNDSTHRNFYVYTDDILGEWSEPIEVMQNGIDPSLYFENGRAYFISNGTADNGENGVIQCEIDITSGKKLSESVCIWHGSGGRFLESPHMYKINGEYYLTAAEGGTEYGHMITYARAKSVWGEFIGYAKNPVLTNRNKAPFQIQGIGHGELIGLESGEYFIVSLGFRQIGIWETFHTLGREVFLTPVHFCADGWFTAGNDGTTDESYEIQGNFSQVCNKEFTFENTERAIDWAFLRDVNPECYEFSKENAVLYGTALTLDDIGSPTLAALRQRDFCGCVSCAVTVDGGEAGLTAYMCESGHYDIYIAKAESGFEVQLRLKIGEINHIAAALPLESGCCELKIRMDSHRYSFSAVINGVEKPLGSAPSRYLSTEVCGGFTGVMLGIYATGNNRAEFSHFICRYD